MAPAKLEGKGNLSTIRSHVSGAAAGWSVQPDFRSAAKANPLENEESRDPSEMVVRSEDRLAGTAAKLLRDQTLCAFQVWISPFFLN
jgi:hypothetical protein